MALADQTDLMVRAKLHRDVANRATDPEVRRLNDAMALSYTTRAELAAKGEAALALPCKPQPRRAAPAKAEAIASRIGLAVKSAS